MSLAIVLSNPYGIVLSADRRLTTTISDEQTNSTESFVLTDHEQKIFLTKSGHGITYTGASGLENQTRTSCTIKRCLSQLNESLSIEDELRLLKQELLAIAGKRNVVLIGAAISNGNRIVLSTSLVSEAITELTNENGNCLAFSGESEILIKLTDMFPVERNAFPLQESINYLRFLTRSVAGVQHYAQINQTVSEECDILVIQDIGAQWITSPETLF